MSQNNREIKKMTDNKFLNIYEVTDLEHHCKGYQYSERRGQDSVAFICYDRKRQQFLLNCEFTPPVGYFHDRAFGGSLDKEGKKHAEIVMEEVEEEAGYKVEEDCIKYVGNCFVSTQMNQTCYLYLVIVEDSQKVERKPQCAVEALASLRWVNTHSILSGDDWKSISILMKAVDKRILKVVTDDITVEA